MNSNLFFLAGTEPSKCSTSVAVYRISLKSENCCEYPHDINEESCVGGVCQNGRLVTIKVESGLFDKIYLFNDEAIHMNVLVFADNHKISALDAYPTVNGDYVFVFLRVQSPHLGSFNLSR